MNKIYDKLLLAVALLLLAGGVFLYLQKSGATPSLNAPVNVEPADNPYKPVAVLPSVSAEASWPEASGNPSRPEWVYDVFTPPKIYIGKDGEFTQEGWKPPVPPPPYGIYLADIERKPYRIQLEGYIEEDRSDASKTLLLMFDEEAQKQVRARPGDDKPEAEFKLISFDIERIRDGDNNIEIVAKATILDQRSGEEVILTHGERRYDSGLTVIIRSEEDPSYLKELDGAPAEFEGPIGQYTLLEINLEESSVKVEKQATEDQEAETQTLKARAATPSSPPPITTPEANTAEEPVDIFDSMF